ncbi:MAG: hypothetical protein GW779_06430 [Candidatus Altiarchaeum hamiconexum]|uniref:Uncharacterized protein n=1 Tax=Candidatus Altarchaeum hamiconexum TaxID=1803513 RepID=A0A8J7YSU8_9ARCH|nr:hypothetical protein [Candidatus Altarchaeum hamiconexum]NCN69389.1 hypothetical protein [Candidatus Altarchaeum hamiconexum]NCS92014.1 hypothetical protein [Candidatus Altarchaeum hamiconexum]NCT01455.1 hypothetical protein [Candidatus Altarchaeum hamiconexum]
MTIICTESLKLLMDNRCWNKDRPRKYTKEQKEEIIKIRSKLKKEESFFIGGKVVMANYNNSHNDKVSKDFGCYLTKIGIIIYLFFYYYFYKL